MTAIIERWKEFLSKHLSMPGEGVDVMGLSDRVVDQDMTLIEDHPELIPLMLASPLVPMSEVKSSSDESFARRMEEANRFYGVLASMKVYVWHMEQLLRLLPDGTDEDVLDIGCGPSAHTTFLVKEGILRGRIVGVDVGDSMLGHSRRISSEEGVELELVQCAVQNLDLGRKFGLALALDCFNWSLAWRLGMRRMCSHIAENGMLVMSHPFPAPRGRIEPAEAMCLLAGEGMDVLEQLRFYPNTDNVRTFYMAKKQPAKRIIMVEGF